MTQKITRFGIVGTGNIAEFHATAIHGARGAVLTAVCDAVPERAEAFGTRQKVAYECDLQTFLAHEDIDAVTIATPSGTHADIAVLAAQAGKHILCEKSLDVTVERGTRIIEACDANHVILACVFQSRINKSVQRIRQALEAGRFGRLVLANAQMKWSRTQEYYDSGKWRGTWALDGGGALMNQSVHSIDLLLYLAGPPASVYAHTGTLTHAGIEVEDNAVAVIRFVNGAMGTIEASTSCAPGFPRRLEISGEYGSVVMEDDRLIRWSFVDEEAGDETIRAEGMQGDGLRGGGSSEPNSISHEGHLRLIEDLCEAIHNGRAPAISGREGLRSVALICGIYASARSGKPHVFEPAET